MTPSGGPAEEGKESGPVRVLIVDDEVSYAQLLAKRMILRGVKATAVNSGREAVQTLRGNAFDAALLDLKMESMDGIETLKMFRVIDPRMKVIILTGHGGEAEARQCIKLGAFDYLVKPCELETIMSRIAKAAKAARAEGEAG